MAYQLLFQKTDTLQSSITSGATSATLTTGNFGSPTGTQLLVIDFDTASAEVVSCSIAGTAITSMTRGVDGTTGVAHNANANVIMAFVPSHYTQLGVLASSDAFTTHNATLTGFSGTPTQANFSLSVGKLTYLYFDIQGTSNTTGFTATMPVTAKRTQQFANGRYVDNGSFGAGAPLISVTAGSNIVTFNTSLAGGTWTASAGKQIQCLIILEAQ